VLTSRYLPQGSDWVHKWSSHYDTHYMIPLESNSEHFGFQQFEADPTVSLSTRATVWNWMSPSEGSHGQRVCPEFILTGGCCSSTCSCTDWYHLL
jgi:hypothetical protein